MKLFKIITTVLAFVQVCFSQVVNSDQTSLTPEQISYALIDLGFNSKLNSLNLPPEYFPINFSKKIPKSSRTLEDIISSSEVNSKKENPEKSTYNNQYYIIAGCFSSINNAESLVLNLKEIGYNSSIVGKTINGLYMVSYNSYFSKNNAYIESEKLNKLGLDTWIKKI